MGDHSTKSQILVKTARPRLMERLGVTGWRALCFELDDRLGDLGQFRGPHAVQLKKIRNYRELSSNGSRWRP
jgi:hypothetical protein